MNVRGNAFGAMLLAILVSCAVAGSPDNAANPYQPKRHFAANAGQWDAQVRFAVIGGSGTAWFCDDRIIVVRPRCDVEEPAEVLTAARESDDMEVIQLRFSERGESYTLDAVDTLPGIANFYLGADESNWRENVSTHRRIRYSSAETGVIIEVELVVSHENTKGEYSEKEEQGVRVSVVDASDKDTRIPVDIFSGSVQKSIWLDGEALQSFMAAIGSGDGDRPGLAKGDQEMVIMYGETNSANFPVYKPVQSTIVRICDTIRRK